ncbi:MAG: tetratricopeptide repeat protein [Deltaproteobacteria bacterium]|nr:tetratricopeptide repeat protein [Deltaproteobacteria bacterium]
MTRGNGDERPIAAPSRRAGSAALLAITILAYLPVLQAGFIWDDDAYVTENVTLRSLEGLRSIWLEPAALPQYYPVVHTSFWVEYALWELAPAGYHLVNVLLHALASILAWRVLARLAIPGAWLAAAIFALHPVHVESVAWITERKNVLSACFYLAAALAYFRYEPPRRKAAEAARPIAWYAAALFLYLAALLSKSVTASLPAALLLLLWWKRERFEWRSVLPLLPFFAVGAALGLHTAWLEQAHVGAQGAEWSLSVVERFLVSSRALCFYLGKLAWPWNLSFIYPRWRIDDAEAVQYLFPLLAFALLGLAWLGRRRFGWGPLVALLYFAGSLFPALGFINVYPHRFSYVADHFQYLASLGPIAAVAAGGVLLAQRLPRRVSLAGAGLLLALLGASVWQQSLVYRDPETLWRDTLIHNPDSYLAHSHLGNILLRRGESRQALDHYREALRVKPDDPASLNNMAWFLATTRDETLRDGPEALALAERAARGVSYGNPVLLDTLAASQAEVGRFEQALETARQALQLALDLGDRELAREIRARTRSYRARRPHRADPQTGP